MQKYLLTCLCVFATFVLNEAKPWCGIYGCNSDENGGDDDYNEHKYGEDALHDDTGYRADNGYPTNLRYGDRIGSRSQNNVDQDVRYGGAQNGLGGYPGMDNGQTEFDVGQNGYGRGQNGYGRGQKGFGGGSPGFEGGHNGFGNGQNGFGGQNSGKTGLSGRRPYNYVPENCPGCNIKTFGVGRGMRNTFNLPEARR